jgi:hypothetical protein
MKKVLIRCLDGKHCCSFTYKTTGMLANITITPSSVKLSFLETLAFSATFTSVHFELTTNLMRKPQVQYILSIVKKKKTYVISVLYTGCEGAWSKRNHSRTHLVCYRFESMDGKREEEPN